MSTGLPISQWPNELTNYPSDWAQHFAPAGDNVPGGVTEKATFANWQRLMAGRVANVAALRLVNAATIPDGTSMWLDGHTTPRLGAGPVVLDKSGALGANRDDNGAYIHAAGGPAVSDPAAWYWRRPVNDYRITPYWWGAVGDANPNVQPGVGTGGTDDGAALEAWLAFGSTGWDDNNIPFTATKNLELWLPKGVFRTDRQLTVNPAGWQNRISGEGMRASVIMAGAAMATLLTISPTPGNTYSFFELENIGLNGGDHADTCLDADIAINWALLRCNLRFAKVVLAKVGGFGCTVENNTFQGRDLADTGRVARAMDYGGGNANGSSIRNNYFVSCLRGIDVNVRPQKLVIDGANKFDQIDQAGIVFRQGTSGAIVEKNYFEDVGHQNTSVEVTTGVFVNVKTAIYAGRTPGSASNNVQGLHVRKNRFSNTGWESCLCVNAGADFTFENNEWNTNFSVTAPVELISTGVGYTFMNRALIRQAYVGNQNDTSISSADPVADTITLSSARNYAKQQPLILTGALPAPLVSGQTYYSLSEGRNLTTIQVSERQIGGTPVDITANGSGDLEFKHSIARMVNYDRVDNPDFNAAFLQIDETDELATFRGMAGGSSLGGHPGSWPVSSGTLTVAEHSSNYEGHRVWSFTGTGVRQFDFALRQTNDRWSIRRKVYRLQGLVNGDGGAGGLRFRFFIDYTSTAGANFVQIREQSITVSDWDEFRGFPLEITDDAKAVRLEIKGNSGTNAALLTRWSISPCAIAPNEAPIATELNLNA